MTTIKPTPDMPEDVAQVIRRTVRNIGITVSEAVEAASGVAVRFMEEVTEQLVDGQCPFCGGEVEPDWSRADVHYEEDPGDPIYGPPPSYEFLIEARDWTWLRCCVALEQLLTATGGDNNLFNDRLSESPHYGVDAWREAVRRY